MFTYVIINKINNKCYVGQTDNTNRRFKRHISNSKNKDGPRYNFPLYAAFRKYGVDNFDFKVLEEFETQTEIDEAEMQAVKVFDSYPAINGYNLTLGCSGGTKGYKHSDEAKMKISLAWKGKKRGKLSSEHSLNLSKSLKGRVAPNKINWTTEQIQVIKNSQLSERKLAILYGCSRQPIRNIRKHK